MRDSRIIGLTGFLGSGKTTAAQILVDDFGFQRSRFADALKRMLKELGLTHAQVDGDEKELPCDLLCGVTPRWAMQTLGTEWGRTYIHKDLWVRATMHRVRIILEDSHAVVLDDCRFQNEADAIRAAGGEVWLIERPSQFPITGHVSESGQTTIVPDRIIFNNGGLDRLRTEVRHAIGTMGGDEE